MTEDKDASALSKALDNLIYEQAVHLESMLKQLGREVSATSLFDNPTIVKMGRTIDELRAQVKELIDERTQLLKSKAELIAKTIPDKVEVETSDGKELDPKGEVKGYDVYYKNPTTGEKVVVKRFTKYDLLEIKYNVEREENTRLLHRVAAQKSENEVLHRKVNDLGHKLCKARRERDQLAEKLRKSEGEAHFYRSLVLEKLAQLIKEER